MLIVTHNDCLQHRPPDGHPESPARLRAVLAALRDVPDCVIEDAPLATEGQLSRAHSVEYLRRLEHLQPQQQSESAAVDPDTWLGSGSVAAGKRAAGAVCAAVDAVMDGQQQRVFCAVRPPGTMLKPTLQWGFVCIPALQSGHCMR